MKNVACSLVALQQSDLDTTSASMPTYHDRTPTLVSERDNVLRVESKKAQKLSSSGDYGDSQSGKDHEVYIREFFRKEECKYSHVVYEHAAAIFNLLKHDFTDDELLLGRRKVAQVTDESPATPEIHFDSHEQKRLTFDLVYSTLKCKCCIFVDTLCPNSS